MSCQTCNTCQNTCESVCQDICMSSCQDTCQICEGCDTCDSSQNVCTSVCQSVCLSSCQDTCQTCEDCDTCDNCQTGCQTNNHVWGEWITVTPATCVSTGVKRRTCTLCSAFEEQTIPIDSNAHSWADTVTYSQTHPHNGSRKCKLCGIQNPNDAYVYTGNYPGCNSCVSLPAPLHLSISAFNCYSIRFYWDRVVNASGYHILLNDIQISSTNDTIATINNLLPATEYSIKVQAYNSYLVSSASEALIHKSPLLSPTNVDVSSIRKTTARISWNSVPDATGYRLYLNNNLIYTGANTSYDLAGLTAGTCYRYAIQAYNTAGFVSLRLEKEFTTIVNKPNKPTASNISYDFVSDGASVTLSWDAVQGATGYHLLMDGNIKYSGENLSYTVVVPSSKSPSRFRVMAYNDAGVSDESDYCNVTVTYNSQRYNAELAKKCAEYALLAYDEMKLNSNNRYYDSKDRGNKKPTVLIDKLQTDGYTLSNDSNSINYGDNCEHNVSHVFATKSILFNGTNRTLVAIIIRGTDGVEWKGNMDVTNTSYDSTMNEHYSFKQAEIDLRTNPSTGLTCYLTKNNISNPVYLITGHSRGAAVANLLAESLSKTAGESNVYAYMFATPNNVKVSSANTERKNIYNFCFNDDFVPQVPLAGWGYSKHGITFVKTAGDLYENNVSFKNDLDVYAADSNKKSVSFNLSGTSSLISHVQLHWENLESYYKDPRIFTRTEEQCITNNLTIPTYNDTYITLYNFFRDIIAPAAMEVDGSSLGVIAPIINPESDYKYIASFFVNGSAISDSIYFGHHAFTYYTAIKYGLFN